MRKTGEQREDGNRREIQDNRKRQRKAQEKRSEMREAAERGGGETREQRIGENR